MIQALVERAITRLVSNTTDTNNGHDAFGLT